MAVPVVIGSVVFEVNGPALPGASLVSRLSRFARSPALTRSLDAEAEPRHVGAVDVDLITLDLGTIDPDRLEQQLEARLGEAFGKALDELKHAAPVTAAAADAEAADQALGRLARLLRHGMPGWEPGAPADPGMVLDAAVSADRSGSRSLLLTALASPAGAVSGILALFRGDAVARIARLVAGPHAELVLRQRRDFAAAHRRTARRGNGLAGFEHALWTALSTALASALTRATAGLTATGFAGATVAALAQHYGLSPVELAHRLGLAPGEGPPPDAANTGPPGLHDPDWPAREATTRASGRESRARGSAYRPSSARREAGSDGHPAALSSAPGIDQTQSPYRVDTREGSLRAAAITTPAAVGAATRGEAEPAASPLTMAAGQPVRVAALLRSRGVAAPARALRRVRRFAHSLSAVSGWDDARLDRLAVAVLAREAASGPPAGIVARTISVLASAVETDALLHLEARQMPMPHAAIAPAAPDGGRAGLTSGNRRVSSTDPAGERVVPGRPVRPAPPRPASTAGDRAATDPADVGAAVLARGGARQAPPHRGEADHDRPGTARFEPIATHADAEEAIALLAAPAGSVLLWPFLPHLFRAAALIEANRFVSGDAALRAVRLLHFLATGKPRAAEHELAAAKLLAGLGLRDPAAGQLRLRRRERRLMDELHAAVGKAWPALRNTSLAGLRESFLLRPARLERSGGDWQLTFEPRPFDLLLRTLPWGLSAVRLPWMTGILHVRWSA